MVAIYYVFGLMVIGAATATLIEDHSVRNLMNVQKTNHSRQTPALQNEGEGEQLINVRIALDSKALENVERQFVFFMRRRLLFSFARFYYQSYQLDCSIASIHAID